jgi:hypothetical protein
MGRSGMIVLASSKPPKGELRHGLNPNDPKNSNAVQADGYTKLEKYLNSL